VSIVNRWAHNLIDPKYRRLHMTFIAVSLFVHLSTHYATYIPVLRGPLGGLPYFRLHILHEAEFLLMVAYAGVVLGMRAGLVAIVVTGLTSIPFILTPYIFGREPNPNEIRDLTLQVVFILMMGYLIILLYDRDSRRRSAESQADTLLEVDRVRNNFMSIAAHELRTPLTTVMGFSELLLARDVPNEDRRKWLGSINSESHRLTELIEELMNVSRIEAGSLEVNGERVELEPIVADAVAAVGSLPAGCELEIDIPSNLPDVWGDRNNLQQVLINLLSNAVKYSPAGGKVSLTVETTDAMMRVGVRDQGLGMSIEDQSKLFTSFYRVQSEATKNIQGTGMGLYIVKSLVEMMGGAVDVQSASGIGSTFSFTVPLWREQSTEAAEPTAA
jgi:signal transduction histidine kinase